MGGQGVVEAAVGHAASEGGLVGWQWKAKLLACWLAWDGQEVAAVAAAAAVVGVLHPSAWVAAAWGLHDCHYHHCRAQHWLPVAVVAATLAVAVGGAGHEAEAGEAVLVAVAADRGVAGLLPWRGDKREREREKRGHSQPKEAHFKTQTRDQHRRGGVATCSGCPLHGCWLVAQPWRRCA